MSPVRTALPTAATKFPIVFNPLLVNVVVMVAQGTIEPVYVVVDVLVAPFPPSTTTTAPGSLSSVIQDSVPFE